MKRKMSLFLCIVLTLSLFTSFAAFAREDAPVEIRVAWWGDTVRHELYNKILDGFESKYPHITLVREPSSWNDYWDKLAIQTGGGNAPDFMGMHAQYASDYIGRGVVAPLDGFIADGTIDLTGWQENVVNTGVVNGVNYMVPMGITFSCHFVNEGILKELGITIPDMDWTWDDVKTIGIEAREKLDAAGKTETWLMTDTSTTVNFWRYYVRQQGRELYTEDGNIGFTVEDAQSFWEMYKEFRELGIVPDPATAAEFANATLEDSAFSRDMVLSNTVPVNQYKLYRSTFPEKDILIVRNPVSANQPVGEYPEGAHFAISAGAAPEKQKAAALLLNYWVNTEESLALFKLDQGVPGNQNLQNAYIENLDEYQKEILEYVNMAFEFATASTFPLRGASEIDALFKSIGEQVQFDILDPATAAQKFYDEAVAIIEKNK